MKTTCLAGIVSLAVFALPAWAQSPKFIRLDLPSSEIAKFSNVCPIRAELPLSKLFESKAPAYRSGKPAVLNCDGAYISLITVEYHPAARGLKPRIHPKVTIALPQGHDKLIEVKYWLMRGNDVLSVGGEEISADEGKSNWENGADLWYDAGADKDSQALSLRIEASFSDR